VSGTGQVRRAASGGQPAATRAAEHQQLPGEEQQGATSLGARQPRSGRRHTVRITAPANRRPNRAQDTPPRRKQRSDGTSETPQHDSNSALPCPDETRRAIPPPGLWEESGSFEENALSWHKFGFAVLDLDGSQAQIRYRDDDGTQTRIEQIT
jgi:hypothetical protein